MLTSPEIFVESCFASQQTNVFVKHDGMWASKIILEPGEVGDKPPVALRLSETETQALMDRLWTAGYRPTEGAGSAGSLAATEYHLEDMRRLVFKTEPPMGEPVEQYPVGVVQHLHGHGIAPDGNHYT